jgi:hypothetical protein
VTVNLPWVAKPLDFACTSEQDRVILCVYELDGDSLRVAASHDTRPVDFKTRPGKAIVIALKRVKE